MLVVDDHEDARALLKIALTNAGADVRACAQSTDALATINTWKADCLLSDIGMPGEDGYALIKKVRALRKKNGGRIPAIALTGFAGIDDKSKAIAAGYQTHIPKPVDLGSLTSEIVRLVQKNRSHSCIHVHHQTPFITIRPRITSMSTPIPRNNLLNERSFSIMARAEC